MGGFSSGLKMAEQLYNLGVKPWLALSLIATRPHEDMANPLWGSWAGDRVVLIGDYSDDLPDFLTAAERSVLETTSKKVFDQDYKEMAEEPNEWLKDSAKLKQVVPISSHHVFVNTDKKQFIDPVTFGSLKSVDDFGLEQDGVMKALFSCLFYSTGGGGGDIDAFKQGRWAGNRLKLVEMSEAYSMGFTDISHEVNKVLLANSEE